jgi:hypothetical protein
MKFQVPFAFGIPNVRDAFNNLRSDAAYMESIKKILESQMKNDKLTDDEVSMLQADDDDFLLPKCNTDKPIVTILDLISSQIKTEIKLLYVQDNRIIPRFMRAVFPTDLMRDEKLSISRIIRLIDCYLGYDYFNIFCLFKSGIPYISLLP